jgi:hypothetical protein
MKREIDFLKNFVEGNININKFEEELYENENLQKLLNDNSINWGYLDHTTPYYYLLELNYNDIRGKLNAQGAVELFLEKKGVEFIKNKQFYDEYSLILDSQPKYLDIDTKFIQKYIFPKENNKTKKEIKEYMKNKFNEYFKYQNKPPRWIQNPNWIIKNDIPLFFLGQMEIKDCKLFHDNGAIYIFVNEKTKEIETVIQLY